MQAKRNAIPASRMPDEMTTTSPPVNEPLRFCVARAAHGAVGLLRTRYPRFVFGLPPAAGDIPVFIFHEVETEVFARQLEYLRTNGYRTLALA